MQREASLNLVRSRKGPWDLAVIGGGATGVGIALDAAARGYATCLFEQADFGKGTSSRSTKLIHGGVRYLQQGNFALVTEALHERGLLRKNAPHLVTDLPFIVPNYALWEAPFYGIGLHIYDLLAGKHGFEKALRSRHLSKAEVLAHIPTLETEGLRGGTLYYDGQFDDARLLMDLAHAAVAKGAALVNYAQVAGLLRDAGGRVCGVAFRDGETGATHEVAARCVINAAGPFVDAIRAMDDPAAERIIAPSQGVHIVLDRTFLPGDAAIMIPRTPDRRVLFAIPWHGHTLVGTTDTAVERPALEPVAREEEIAFLLETAGRYLHRRPGRGDILSVFAGIRPLVKSGGREGGTAGLSRDHHLEIAASGLVTITGGKWTTYRRMAQDTVSAAAAHAGLEARACVTESLAIGNGAPAAELEALIAGEPGLGEALHPALAVCGAQVVWAVRHEMARTLEDVLSRRTRALLLDARAAVAMAPAAGALMARELGRDAAWVEREVVEFALLAHNYMA